MDLNPRFASLIVSLNMKQIRRNLDTPVFSGTANKMKSVISRSERSKQSENRINSEESLTQYSEVSVAYSGIRLVYSHVRFARSVRVSLANSGVSTLAYLDLCAVGLL